MKKNNRSVNPKINKRSLKSKIINSVYYVPFYKNVKHIYTEIDAKIKQDLTNEDHPISAAGSTKRGHRQSKLGSELNNALSNRRENSSTKVNQEMKLSLLNEITPSTALPKGYAKKLDPNSKLMEQTFKSKGLIFINI
jgi:hypothetical protein